MEPQELTLEILRTHRFDIEIPNFEKWNPEPKGGKPRHWFKIDAYIADDPKIKELTAFQFVFYITLLAYRARSKPAGWCSDGTRDVVGGRSGSLLRDLRLSLVPFPSGFRGGPAGARAILKLSKLKLIEITNVRSRLEEIRLDKNRSEALAQKKSATTEPELPQQGTQVLQFPQKPPEPTAPKLDFELIYREYPRHEGKSRGLKVCQRQIRTPEDYDALLAAVLRYKHTCTAARTEKKYIKHFGTFMSEWRDWLEPDCGMIARETTGGRSRWPDDM